MIEMILGGISVFINPNKIINILANDETKSVTLTDILKNKYILTKTQWNYFISVTGKSLYNFNKKEFIDMGGTEDEINNGGLYEESVGNGGDVVDPPMDLSKPHMDNLVSWYEFIEPNPDDINVIKSLVGDESKDLVVYNCLHTTDNGFSYNGFFFGCDFKTCLEGTGKVFEEVIKSRKCTIIALYKDDLHRYEDVESGVTLPRGIENDVFSTYSFLNLKVFSSSKDVNVTVARNGYMHTSTIYNSMSRRNSCITNFNTEEYTAVSYNMNLDEVKNEVRFNEQSLNEEHRILNNTVKPPDYKPSLGYFRIGDKSNMRRNTLTLGALFFYDEDLTDKQRQQTIQYFLKKSKETELANNVNYEKYNNICEYAIYNVSDVNNTNCSSGIFNTDKTQTVLKLNSIDATPVRKMTFREYIDLVNNDIEWLQPVINIEEEV